MSSSPKLTKHIKEHCALLAEIRQLRAENERLRAALANASHPARLPSKEQPILRFLVFTGSGNPDSAYSAVMGSFANLADARVTASAMGEQWCEILDMERRVWIKPNSPDMQSP